MTTQSVAARRVVRGTAGAPGIARGPWARFERAGPPSGGRVSAELAELEVTRLIAAADGVAAASERLAEDVRRDGHQAEADIFSAHAAIARDPELIDTAAGHIRNELVDGPAAVFAAAQAVAELLHSLGDELLRGRATDVLDVGDRIARQLAGLPPMGFSLAAPAIIVGDDLSPSVTATLPRERVLGIALEGSSPTAHAAILARAYGIPAVVGATGLIAAVAEAGASVELLVDGSTGEIVVAPNQSDGTRFAERSQGIERDRERNREEARLPAETIDGTAIALLANIGSPAEAEAAVALGARGVGLFRTEFLFLERSDPPPEEEQVAAYAQVAEAFRPDPVTVRLLDVGGDKPIPYLSLPAEDNPFLGVRALRLAETRPDLFLTQLRACYRAATAGRIKVMAPMIADAGDAATLRALADRARAESVAADRAVGEVDLGVMLEIPSAILIAETYFGEIAFASLGTNDLLQYALAVDRGNPALERYRDALHPALLRLVKLAVDGAARFDIELSICGEMAGDPTAALALVGLGIRSLSMAASSLPAVRRAVRASSLAALEAAAADGLAASSAAEVRSRFQSLAALAD
ncbi:MAG TPA: phosphoenolpyruvate--protein phosphotransferase [Candidatus Limnocylindria bacterium]|nr:phosphoenolpyruvate--protein phosphotransferase [Candidatus Limnocylindria bacterium]